MSKLFYEAMRVLPVEFIEDETRHSYSDSVVFVINPNLPPHMYTAADGWHEMKFVEFAPGFTPPTKLTQTP